MKRLLALLILTAHTAHAESTTSAFLKMGAGARALAMANAHTAAAGDVDALFFNPASLSALDRPELSFSHAQWVEDTVFDVLTYGHPTRVGTFAVNAMRLGGGDLEGRDEFRRRTGHFSADDVAIGASWGKSLNGLLGVGATGRFVRSRIASDHAEAYAFDAGALTRVPGQPVWLGVAVLNMGTRPTFIDQADRLPLTVAAGVAARPVRPLALTLDWKQELYEDRTHIDWGAEYQIALCALRLGFTSPLSGERDKRLVRAENLRGGFGVKISRYRLDYALAPVGDLGLSQRFTLSVRFGSLDGSSPLNLQSPLAETDISPTDIASLN